MNCATLYVTRRRCSNVLLAAFLSAVTSVSAQGAASTTGGAPQARVYLNASCVVADEPFVLPAELADSEQRARMLPLLSMLVGKVTEALLKQAVTAVWKKMKGDGERKNTLFADSREINLYQTQLAPQPAVQRNSALGCATIVVAKKFQAEGGGCASAYVPKALESASLSQPEAQWRSTRADDSVENRLRRADICLDGGADAVYEARFEYNDDGKRFRLRNAGYQVSNLTTASGKDGAREVFYTLEFVNGARAAGEPEVLGLGWVDLGQLIAGTAAVETGGDSPPWAPLPELSATARRAYEERTQRHRQLANEIQTEELVLVRNQRVAEELSSRMKLAESADLAAALGQEKNKAELQLQLLEARIAGLKAEYAALPQQIPGYMPVLVRAGITESRTAKAAQSALEKIVQRGGDAQAKRAPATAGATP
jgi:hypothetical protein